MFKTRPGIVLTRICDQSILVAAYEARKYCPYTMILNESGAAIWECLEAGKDLLGIKEYLLDEFEIPNEIDLNEMVDNYINILYSNGYLLDEER